MARYVVKIERRSLYGGGGTDSPLYKDASNEKELKAIIKDAKDNVVAFRISINGVPIYESKGNGAQKRWKTLGTY